MGRGTIDYVLFKQNAPEPDYETPKLSTPNALDWRSDRGLPQKSAQKRSNLDAKLVRNPSTLKGWVLDLGFRARNAKSVRKP